MTGVASAKLPYSARWQAAIYRKAASLLSAHCLSAPEVESIFIRRSVAVGEAKFPWSDVDLGLVLSRIATGEEEGLALERLWRRYRLARCLFPRLGELEVHTVTSFAESAIDDPYRASIDRRAALLTHGSIPEWAAVPIAARDAIRRLVFWFDVYLPRSLITGNHRNARKFAIEIWNAWLTASGSLREPYLSRRETEQDWRKSSEASLLAQAEESPEGAFRVSLALATRAHAILRPPLPRLTEGISAEVRFLPGSALRTVHILPAANSPLPGGALRPNDLIVTPELLDLYLRTQNPLLWHGLPSHVHNSLCSSPSADDWLLACHRLSASQRLRVSGFVERGAGRHSRRLGRVAYALSLLERGVCPSDETPAPQPVSPAPETPPGIGAYYREEYPSLLREAATLRLRAQRLLASRSAPGNGENVRGGI